MTTAGTASGEPRRFLLEVLPPFHWLYATSLTIAYVDLGPDWRLTLHLRSSGPGPTTAATLQRTGSTTGLTIEGVVPVATPDALAGVLASEGARTLEKTRRGAMLAGVWWEVDEYAAAHQGLLLARTEDAVTCATGAVPGWAVRDVTDDPSYDETALAGT